MIWRRFSFGRDEVIGHAHTPRWEQRKQGAGDQANKLATKQVRRSGQCVAKGLLQRDVSQRAIRRLKEMALT